MCYRIILTAIFCMIASVASALGVPHLDLRPELTQGLRHYYDHDHFTPEGAAAAAQVIAAALIKRQAEVSVHRITQPRIPLAAR